MSWSDRVRLYYSSAYMMGVSSIYVMIVCIFTGRQFNLSVAVAAVCVYGFIEFLHKKISNIYTCIGIPIVLAFVFELFFNTLEFAIADMIFILVLNVVFIKNFGEEIDYMNYRDKLGIITLGIAASMVLCMFTMMEVSGLQIFRISIIYCLISILALREAMGYSCNIRKTAASVKADIGLLTVSIVMCSNLCFSVLIKIWKLILFILGFIIEKAAFALSIPLTPLVNKLYDFIKSRMADFDSNEIIQDGGEAVRKNVIEKGEVNYQVSNALEYILIAVVILLIVFIVNKLIKSIKGRVEKYNDDDSYEEIVEDIKKPSKRNKREKIKYLSFKGISNKEKILVLYDKLVSFYRKKDIFKGYMTPTQFKNNIVVHQDNVEGLDYMTDIYNKTRFSEHDISSEDAEKVEKVVKSTIKTRSHIKHR